jgi:hypothetical protein
MLNQKVIAKVILITLLISLPIFLGAEPATAGIFGDIFGFFLKLVVGVGRWVGQTVVGGLIENTIDYLTSFLNPNDVKPDYWGALTGKYYGEPLKFVTKDQTTCYPPIPTKMIRDSVESQWRPTSEVKKLIADCIRSNT